MARTRCTVCGKQALYKCKYCGDNLCKEHLLPEMHWCVGLEEYKRELEEGKISPIPLEAEAEPEEPQRKKGWKDEKKVYTNPFGIFSGNYSFLLLFLIFISFVLQLLIPGGLITSGTSTSYEKLMWLNPQLIEERPWTLITHIFLHGSFGHFLFNMLFFIFFAPVLERKIGSPKFLLIFFLSGIVAGIGWCLTSDNPAVGASGALYGVFGALAVLMPRMRMYIFPLPIPLEMWMVVILFAIFNFLMIGTTYPIAFTAHLSGLFFGLLAGLSLKRK